MRTMLKGKIHRARITRVNLDYEGSITIDRKLMEEADILPYEQVEVLNINNGRRFITYVIAGACGSGDVWLNGAAARLGRIGDKVIIISYCQVPAEREKNHEATIVLVDENNKSRE